jgi:glycogen(starch) synthase
MAARSGPRPWQQRRHRTRVLMMTDAVGGVWNMSLDLAAGLRSHHIDVALAVLGPAPSPEQRRAAEEGGVHLEHAPYRLEWMADPWADVDASAAWLGELEQRLGCDLVHLNGYSYARYPFRSPKVIVGHSCVLSWWHAVRSAPLPPSWEQYHRAVSAGLSAAQHVVAPTVWMASELHRLYGGAVEASVIYNGRSARQYEPGAKRSFVLAAGRIWDDAKNLQALSRISRAIPWPIEIAGPRSLTPDDRDASAASDRDFAGVELLGPLGPEMMARAYGAAPIYALPARYEPFGLTVLEAALAGCALVLGDIPSLRELWDGAAVFVDPADDGALAKALLNLINWPVERQQLARRARSRARRYSRDRMIGSYVRLYSRLLAWPTAQGPSGDPEVACVS